LCVAFYILMNMLELGFQNGLSICKRRLEEKRTYFIIEVKLHFQLFNGVTFA